MNYPIDVPSIAHMHRALANNPNILNDPVMQGVFSSKAAGDPLDIHALRESEDIIKTLSGSGRTYLLLRLTCCLDITHYTGMTSTPKL